MQKSTAAAMVIVSLLVGGMSGYAAGRNADSTALSSARKSGHDEGVKEVEDRVNGKLVALGVSSDLDKPMLDVYGTVKEVSANGIVVSYDAAQFSLVENGIKTVTVNVGGNAVVERMSASAVPTADADAAAKVQSGVAGGGGGVTGLQAGPPPSAPPGAPTGAISGTPGGSGSVPAQLPAGATTASTKPETLANVKVGEYVHVVSKNDIRSADVIEAGTLTVFDPAVAPSGVGSDPSKMPFGRGGVTGLQPYVPTK